MRIYVTYYFLLLTFTINAQTIKLDYEPKGQIIKFYIDSLTIYTDSTSLFAVYTNDRYRHFDLEVKNFILKQIKEANNDTVTFSGNLITFNDSIGKKYKVDWKVDWYVTGTIVNLTKDKKLKIYDKHNQLVKRIVTKKIGKKKNHNVKRVYINKATSEEMFRETLPTRIRVY